MPSQGPYRRVSTLQRRRGQDWGDMASSPGTPGAPQELEECPPPPASLCRKHGPANTLIWGFWPPGP